MTTTSTQDKINDWVSSTYGTNQAAANPASTFGAASAAASAPASTTPPTGMLGAASATPAPAATGTASGSSADSSSPNVASWYRSVLGRDGDAGGVSYWQNLLSQGKDPNAVFNGFEGAAGTNAEKVKGITSWQDANNYSGPMSSDNNTVVDDWGRNVLGRDLTSTELATWKGAMDQATTPAAAQQVYSQFVSQMGGQVKNHIDGASASQLSASTPTTAVGGTSITVGDWGRNVLGRNLTGDELTKWSSALSQATTPDAQQQVYRQFLTEMGGQVRNPVSMDSASAVSGALPNQQYMPYLIANSQLTNRTIDPATETVQGQLGKLLAADSPVLQQVRADAMRSANERGMLNSTMAASGGEDAVIRSATPIASSDAGYYNEAANYNAAAHNQALMANTTAQNNFLSQTQGIDAQASQQDKSLASQASQQDKQLASQQQIAQMQNDTTKWQAELSNATSRYNTDSSYKQQADGQVRTLSNNIINNMDLSPDRKAAMLEALGQGTSAKKNNDGTITPGTGLAGAVYVISSTSADLNPAGTDWPGPQGSS